MRRLYQPVYPNVYVPRGVDLSAQERAQAAWLWSKRRGIVAGLFGGGDADAKWIYPSEPAELIHDNRRPPPYIRRQDRNVLLMKSSCSSYMRVTTAARTAFDLGRHIHIADCGSAVSTLSPSHVTSSTSMSKR